ncbi:DNA cytosine methyltransferase [Schlesneria paludicola]|uniref:DNA cytosine methyltransferase n=1 Tax=Schlesneria paludicola TaxID=360056 RepID=UPI0006824B25|nr:DNA cytosine methyltransferase [Schlesneria paludicola]
MRKLHVNHLHSKRWMIVDNFAGGGGASTGIEMAVNRSPDVAINHDPEALAMHAANHPFTRHYATDVFEVDPQVVVRGKPVGLAWFSPDCTHHSKARGGKPIREAGKKSRGLAWVVVNWAKATRPRVIMLENVEEFAQWGPLVKTPRGDVPCPARRGKTFKKWVRSLERLGYRVEWRELRACDFGSPTIRKRLFVVARCDGQQIVWPNPTHGKPGTPDVVSGKLLPWRTAAEIIDWDLSCPSIFMSSEVGKAIGVKRPLAENTLKRIAAGLKRYVIDNPRPFIVCCNHGGDWFRGRGLDHPMSTVTGSKGDALVAPFVASPAHSTTTGRGPNVWNADTPLRTVTGSNDKCVVAPYLTAYHGQKVDGSTSRSIEMSEPLRTPDTQNRFGFVAPVMTYAQQGGLNRSASEPLHTLTASRKDQNAVIAPVLSREFGKSVGCSVTSPVPTVMPAGQGKTSVVQAFLAQHNTGVIGHRADTPLSTITGRGTQQQIVEAAFLSHSYTSNTRGGEGRPETPLKTVVAGGQHHACVKAFLLKYYSEGGQHQACHQPVHTIPTVDRLGVVKVDEVEYEIVDIGMRMLTARELFRAQGFPDSYKIDVPAANRRGTVRPLPKDAQVRMCGNSVCPQVAAALVSANCAWLVETGVSVKKTRQLEFAGV